MDVTVHIGAHRCATTSFQSYLRHNSVLLREMGIGFWGPGRTRAGLFRAILPGPRIATGRDLHRRAIGRVQMHLTSSAGQGLRSLLISDENMAGTLRGNLRMGELYCGVGERLARFGEAFDGRIRHVALNIRCLDTYWASALGFGLTRGHGLPGRAQLQRLATNPRSWRDVITDVACALPDVAIWVLPFETFAGRPEAQLAAIARVDARSAPSAPGAPKAHARDWLNRTPRLPQLRTLASELGQDWPLPEGDGRWQPFTPSQSAMMREAYADDLMWLTGGADGLARLMPDPDKICDSDKKHAGLNPPRPDMARGRHDDQQERRVARAR